MTERTNYGRVLADVTARDRTSGCWLLPTKQIGTYVRVGIVNKNAHVLALELASGEPADGRCALHSCDNPPCYNPAHLWWGTHGDNVADKMAKGRQPKGEATGMARLTDEQVRMIRSSSLSLSALARELGVSISTVHRVRTGECWGHVS